MVRVSGSKYEYYNHHNRIRTFSNKQANLFTDYELLENGLFSTSKWTYYNKKSVLLFYWGETI